MLDSASPPRTFPPASEFKAPGSYLINSADSWPPRRRTGLGTAPARLSTTCDMPSPKHAACTSSACSAPGMSSRCCAGASGPQVLGSLDDDFLAGLSFPALAPECVQALCAASEGCSHAWDRHQASATPGRVPSFNPAERLHACRPGHELPADAQFLGLPVSMVARDFESLPAELPSHVVDRLLRHNPAAAALQQEPAEAMQVLHMATLDCDSTL